MTARPFKTVEASPQYLDPGDKLLDGQDISAGNTESVPIEVDSRFGLSFQTKVAGATALAGDIFFKGSNDGANWVDVAFVDPSGNRVTSIAITGDSDDIVNLGILAINYVKVAWVGSGTAGNLTVTLGGIDHTGIN